VTKRRKQDDEGRHAAARTTGFITQQYLMACVRVASHSYPTTAHHATCTPQGLWLLQACAPVRRVTARQAEARPVIDMPSAAIVCIITNGAGLA
jgi:hypothetical protein